TRLTDGDLVIDWGFGSVRVDRAFDARYTVETLRFNNGTTVDLTTLSPETHGTGASESIYGNTEENGSRDDTLRGFDGNDTLYGYDGDDILDGGEGNDTMYGAEGKDTYLVGLGEDYISDYGSADLSDGKDVIRLAAGIKQNDVSFLRLLDGDLLIDWGTGSVRINVAFDSRYAVESLRFNNNTTLDLTTLAVETHGTGGNDSLYGNQEEYGSRDDVLLGMDGNDALYGYDGDDVLNGGLGDDRLYGYTGDDTYVVSRGNDIFDDGRSGSTDTILFKTVASADDLTMTRTGSYDLQILWSGGEVILRNHFYSDDYAFERIVFSNGSSMELDI
ncbi:MAG: hypothetical protein KDK24_03665, partial [Pseudooceanicola sp.]|nr:hypothetical protein [Pseudooceanicola sp.]